MPSQRPILIALFAGALATAMVQEGTQVAALLEGKEVRIRFARPAGKERAYSLGPWVFGARLRMPAAGKPDMPHDARLNMYIVAPGTQHRSAEQEYDHNLIINGTPLATSAPAEFDVYWAIVLDPRLRNDLRLERELLIAAQEEFTPGDLFEFDDLAGADFLRAALKMNGLPDLRPYRRRRNTLPRVLILPAGFAFRAQAEP